MPVPRKILIRVIGAPLLVAALCGVIYWGNTLQQRGEPNTPVRVLVMIVSAVCVHELCTMAAVKGIATARWAGILAIAFFYFPWGQATHSSLLDSYAPEMAMTGLLLYLLNLGVSLLGAPAFAVGGRGRATLAA